jgi:ABC-type lipoprotein release transport system permease subunit
MLLKLALRNLTAHKKRSLVTILLTTITTALLVFSTAWMDGSHHTMIKNGVEIYSGYIQITGRGFRKNPSFEHLIFDAQEVRGVLANTSDIAVFGSRFESFVLFSKDEKAVGGMLTGIEPDREIHLSRLAASLQEGAFLQPDDGNQVYIGRELARRLKVGVGDRLAFVGSGADYSFAADMLQVKGIFQTGLFEFDASSAFVPERYFSQIMAAENYASHFIVLPRQPDQAEQLAARLGHSLGAACEVVSWKQSMAGLVKAMRLDSVFGYITLAIIFTVIFFVIMIYTLLTVFSRIREIGILRAIGTRPGQILVMLLLESCLLALFSVLPGGLLGSAFAWYFHLHPIVFAGFEEQFKQYGLAVSAMPTAFMPLTILRDMAVMFFLTILATLYPILKVNRMPPVKAIYHV